jgi:hypothetical protein
MKLTLKYILDSLKEEGADTKKYLAGVKEQLNLEGGLLRSTNSCEQLDPKLLLGYIDQANIDILNNDIKVNFYHYPTMKVMQCLTTTALQQTSVMPSSSALNIGFSPSSPNSPLTPGITNPIKAGTLEYNQQVKDLLHFVLPISQEVKPVYRGHLTPNPLANADKDREVNNFVIKAPVTMDNRREMLHECIVGFYATNLMREKGVPNFAFIYGSFDCSAPIINPATKSVLSYCDSNDDLKMASYVIYERINGDSFYSYIANANNSLKDIMDLYLQVVLALDSAKSYQFTHYDLHPRNIILRPYSTEAQKSFYIKYPTSRGTFYFQGNGIIATIIDYGMSHISIGGVSYGRPLYADARNIGVYRDKYHPLHDTYRLFSNIVYLFLYYKLDEKYEKIKSLFSFFTDEFDDNFLVAQNKTYHGLPYTNRTKNVDPADFIALILNFYDKEGWVSPLGPIDPSIPIIGESLSSFGAFSKADSFNQEISKIGLAYNKQLPKSFREFNYQYMNTLDVMKLQLLYNFVNNLGDIIKGENVMAYRYSSNFKALNTEEQKDYLKYMVIPNLPLDASKFNQDVLKVFFPQMVNFIVSYRSLKLMCSSITPIIELLSIQQFPLGQKQLQDIKQLKDFHTFYMGQLEIFMETYTTLLGYNEAIISYLLGRPNGMTNYDNIRAIGYQYAFQLKKLW